MKLLYKLFFFVLFFYPFNKVEANHDTLSAINYIAKKVSLGIETPGSSGSGFIIGKKNKEYFFLTAGHVAISDPTKEEYWVYSVADKKAKRYRVTNFISPEEFKGKDIVIGTFKTNDDLNIVPIFSLGEFSLYEELRPNYEYYTYQRGIVNNEEKFDYANNIHGYPLVAGVSTPTEAITVPLFRTSIAYIQGKAVGNQNGYETIYSTTSTVPGMSGGGLFGARQCPLVSDLDNLVLPTKESLKNFSLRDSKYYQEKFMDRSCMFDCGFYYGGVIGMHGMSEEYLESGSRSGTGLAIPMSLLSEFFQKNYSKYGIPTGKDYYINILNYCYGDKQNDF